MRLTNTVLTAFVAAVAANAYAATTPASLANEAQKLQSAPAAAPKATSLKQQPLAQNNASATASFNLTGLRFTGEGLVQDLQTKLTNLTSGDVNQRVTLRALQDIADKVTLFLRAQGYPAAVAYIPAQSTTTGKVEIAVLLGRFDGVSVDNQSNTDEQVFKHYFSDSKVGSFLTTKGAEAGLSRLNRLYGLGFTGALIPSDKSGGTLLRLAAVDTEPRDYYLYADDYASESFGYGRVGAIAHFNNPGKVGDRVTVGANVTVSPLTNLARKEDNKFGYNLQANTAYERAFGLDSKATAAATVSGYKLGGVFAQANFTGYSLQGSLTGNTYLQQTANFKSAVEYSGTVRFHGDSSGPTNQVVSRSRVLEFATLGFNNEFVNGNFRLPFNVSATVGGRQELSQAKVDPYASAFWHRLNAEAAASYQVGQFQLYGSVTAQFSASKLDSSELFTVGGYNGVRAYEQSEANAESGVLGSVEARWLSTFLQPYGHQFDARVFFDAAVTKATSYTYDAPNNQKVTVNPEAQSLKAVGVGFDLRLKSRTTFKLDLGVKVADANYDNALKAYNDAVEAKKTNANVVVPQKPGRFRVWFQLAQSF